MGLGDFLKKQLVDVIDWVDEPGVLAIRYPMQDREIQNGGQLTVREGQVAMFHNEGRLADAFGPGQHTLVTQNLPLLTAIMNWDKGFKSPFKADVYFFSQREQTGLKWGTPQPITVRDKEFGPLRIRAFGSYSFRIEDVATFAVKMMGSLDRLTVTDLDQQLRAVINTAIATALGGGEVAFVDLAGNQQAMSEKLKGAVEAGFKEWGLSCRTFFVESVSLPENVQEYLDKGSQMRVLGNLDQYAKFQAADSIQTAAANPGGLAGIGASAAAGMAIGQQMAAGLGGVGSGGATSIPAATPQPEVDPYEQIEKLHKLMVAGAITQEEFDAKKTALLAKI
jgi:membrane protease subunit (stomatin/prohibitin family)